LIDANISLSSISNISVYNVNGDDHQVHGFNVWTKMTVNGKLNDDTEETPQTVDLKVFMGFDAYNVSSL